MIEGNMYKELLNKWYLNEVAEGRVTDLKLFEMDEGNVEQTCKAIYETVTGLRKTEVFDTSSM